VLTNSVARCCASAALPPFPQINRGGQIRDDVVGQWLGRRTLLSSVAGQDEEGHGAYGSAQADVAGMITDDDAR